MPCGASKYWNLPNSVINVVNFELSSSRGTGSYPLYASNTVLRDFGGMLLTTSKGRGVLCVSLSQYLLMGWKSIGRLGVPSFLLRWGSPAKQSGRNEGIFFKLWRKEIPKIPDIFIMFHWPQATYQNRSRSFIALLIISPL